MKHQRPTKVAIIGGGCAAMTTAFELSRPEHEGCYEITVYQLGWRLGGKGASGRGPADRIEEHGLHLWMGFYENAFRIMRECYRELDRDPETCPLARWTDAFTPDEHVAVADRSPSGKWLPWKVKLGVGEEGLPGDPLPPGHRWTAAHYIRRSWSLVRTLLVAIQTRQGNSDESGPRDGTGPSGGSQPDDILRQISKLMRFGELATLTGLIEGVRVMDLVLQAMPLFPTSTVGPFYEAIQQAARQQLETLVQTDDEMRRLWEIIDLVLVLPIE